ncbi:MAG: PstS family phosphate ABC transporter substrate-binding protein [Actinomycetota bacterium]|nr:PstS family phosphate ABC transporter substrate-binding protein [Actinomycetota bacterium]
MKSISRKWTAVMAVIVFAGFAGGALAGAAKLKGRITADGSSTVGPYTTSAAEGFQRKHSGVQVTVGISGTGGGFERFCNGEIDLADASRPIKSTEYAKCREKGIKWVAFTVANDGIAIVVNKQNTWANCLTVDQLKKIWAPGSKVDNWKDVDASFPDVKLKLYGPGTDSGTFDFFTEKINGKSKSSRSDYSATENDNIAVQGVTGERGGLAYFGLSYFEANQGKLNLVKVNDGRGCIAPSKKTVQNGTYKPLSRPLFIYSKRTSFRRPEVRSFIGYILNNERAIATKARFVSLTDAQLRNSRSHYRQALKQVK